MKPLVAFDLDDTLYHEADYVRSALTEIACKASQTGLVTFENAINSLRHDFDSGCAFDNLEHTVDGKITATEMLRVYREHFPSIRLNDDARVTLSWLHNNGFPLALITDGRKSTQRNKIMALGIDRYFTPENIIISEETGGDKTTPVPFNTIEAIHPGIPKVYIGDNLAKDFLWPNRMGWITVCLRDHNGMNIFPQNFDRLPSPDYAPKYIIDSLTELPEILHNLR